MTTATDTQTHIPKLDAAGLKLSAHTAAITKAEHNDRQFDFTLSSEEPDRMNDVVTQLGIDLKAFRTNPVVLWAHNRGFDTPPPPVARVERLWIRDGNLMGTVKFPDPGVHALADTLQGLVSTGFLNAVSIGFRPIETSFDEERGGTNFLRTELVELSLVPVPMNASALIEMSAAAKGVNVVPLTEWVESAQKMLDAVEPKAAVVPEPTSKPDEVTVPLATIETMIKDAISAQPEFAIPAGYELKKVVVQVAPIPTSIPTTPTQPTTGHQSELLKGVIKAALDKSAAQEMNYHTGRLED